MSIEGIKGLMGGLSPIQTIEKPSSPIQVDTKNGQKSFGEVFAGAIGEVDGLQKEADNQIEGLVVGKEGVTPHGAMIALDKAEIAFNLMSQIRSKIIRAYEDVIRTQV